MQSVNNICIRLDPDQARQNFGPDLDSKCEENKINGQPKQHAKLHSIRQRVKNYKMSNFRIESFHFYNSLTTAAQQKHQSHISAYR